MKKNQLMEKMIHGLFLVLGLITVGCVLLITVYLVISGIPAIREIGLIDFLFGTHPLRIDENYTRFFSHLTGGEDLDPFLANRQILDALSIAFDDGTRIFSLFGDEGSGRKFTIRHFCSQRNLSCISVNCAKLFVYDFRFVDQALWAAVRECILTDACVCMDSLSYARKKRTSSSATWIWLSANLLPRD